MSQSPATPPATSPTEPAGTDQPSTKKSGINLSFVAALSLAVLAASLLVTAGFYLYWQDTNRKYDIARPGQDTTNQTIDEDDTTDTTSVVDAPAAKKKLDFLTKEINALESTNKFNPDDLSDQNLHLAPSDQPSF